MTKTKELAFTSQRAQITLWIALAAISGALPLFIHQQWVTGPIINAILIACTLSLGFWQASVIAFLPSGMALISGLLPPALTPVISAIIFGNILLIAGVHSLKSKPILGIISGALAKFLWLTIASSWIMQFFIPDNFLNNITTMLSWPQLATALIGGAIALGALNLRKQ